MPLRRGSSLAAAEEASTIDIRPATTAAPTAPGPWMALGWIVLYFALQAAGSSVLVVLLAIATGHLHDWHGVADFTVRIRETLQPPGMQALLVMLTLGLAAATILWLVWRRSPRLWSLAQPPGFGFVRPSRLGFLALAVVIGLLAPVLGGWRKATRSPRTSSNWARTRRWAGAFL